MLDGSRSGAARAERERDHSTTFGTTKKSPSRSGALATMIARHAAFGDDVVALLHLHRHDRRHRLDVADIDLVQLLDEAEDRIQLALQRIELIVADGDPRKSRDALDGISVDGHRISS